MKKSAMILNLVHELEDDSIDGSLREISNNNDKIQKIREMVDEGSKHMHVSLFHKKIDKQIHHDWQRGRTIDWLAYDYGKSRKSILTCLKREINWESRVRKPKFSEAITGERLEIMEYQYFSGLPIKNLAEMFKTSEYQIKKVIQNYGWNRSSQSL